MFSKWIECVPLRNANGSNILKALEDCIVFRLGAPEILSTDNGTKFVNKSISEAAKQLGIIHSTTPANHAQANPVERMNRVLKTPFSFQLI